MEWWRKQTSVIACCGGQGSTVGTGTRASSDLGRRQPLLTHSRGFLILWKGSCVAGGGLSPALLRQLHESPSKVRARVTSWEILKVKQGGTAKEPATLVSILMAPRGTLDGQSVLFFKTDTGVWLWKVAFPVEMETLSEAAWIMGKRWLRCPAAFDKSLRTEDRLRRPSQVNSRVCVVMCKYWHGTSRKQG